MTGGGVGKGVGVGLGIWKVADAERPVFCPVAVTVWLPGWAVCGTTKVVENVPLLLTWAEATGVESKLTLTVSLCPNPLPLTCTVVPA